MYAQAIGAAVALGSSIYGAVKSGEQNRAAERLIAKQREDNRRWHDIEMTKDYTQRADVQAAIKRQREMLDEQYKQARRTNVVAGGSDEALAMQQEAANKSLSSTMTDVAAAGAQYKDRVDEQYRAQDAALNQQQAANLQQQAENTAAAASQATNAGLSLMGTGTGVGTKAGDGSSAPSSSGTGGASQMPAQAKSTDLSPSSIESPSGQVMSPAELDAARKSKISKVNA